jgi:hypothetical protein
MRVITLVVLLLVGCGGPPRHALVVGVDTYTVPGITPLKGARNDARALAALLRGRYGFDRVVLLEDATRAQLLAGLEALLAQAEPGAQLVFHFSGHGAQVRDQNGDEPDLWDEALVPADSGRMGARNDVIDDVLAGYVARAEAAGAELTVILDSCYSGTGLRDGVVSRSAPAVGEAARPAVGGTLRDAGDGAPYTLIAAAAAGERAREVVLPDGTHHGALSWALVDALQYAPAGATWRSVMDRVRFAVGGQFPFQHPQLEGQGADRVVFGDRSRVSAPGFALEPVGDGFGLSAGSVLGAGVGARLVVLSDGAEVGQLKVVAATPWTARAVLESGAVPGGALARLVERAAPSTRLAVVVDAGLDGLRSAVEQVGQLTVGLAGRLRFGRGPKGRVGLWVGGRLDGALERDDAAGHGRLLERARRWARWYALADLHSQDALPVTFSVDAQRPIQVGDPLQLVVRNGGAQGLYLGLVALGSDGSVAVLYPVPGAQEVLAGGSEWRRPLEAFTPGVDLLKLVVATEPFDLTLLVSEVVRAGPPGGHALNGWLAAVGQGVRGGAVSFSRDSWAVREVLVRTVPRFSLGSP